MAHVFGPSCVRAVQVRVRSLKGTIFYWPFGEQFEFGQLGLQGVWKSQRTCGLWLVRPLSF